jgi:hypothetical protein
MIMNANFVISASTGSVGAEFLLVPAHHQVA